MRTSFHRLRSLLRTRIRKAAFLLVSVSVLAGFAYTDELFEVSKNLDIFTTLYREVNLYYVDGTDPGKLMKTGIDAMLSSLDPYTTFIPESDMEEYRFMTTGQYGGIGAVIRQQGDHVVVSEPYEGFPAQRADLRAGDVLLEVDGKSAKGKKTDDVSRILKGTPGTEVKLVIRREGSDSTILKILVREEIKVKPVPYFAMLDSGIGYIRLTNFTDRASDEVASAVRSLKSGKELRGVVLDLRGNPGGLLQEAVDISGLFLPKGEEIVSTRGKMSEMDRTYRSDETPLEVRIPLAILVNSGSASASEIVSGAIQDLDRGVVIGQRTYGKGLVQTTRPLSYNTQLKVTTAKYYIPSGRCIQALDYTHRNEDGSVGKVPDSLMHEFKTRAGRIVKDGGGILPDVITGNDKLSKVATGLLGKDLVFNYATRYRTLHDSIGPVDRFILTDADWNDFLHYIEGKEYDYSTLSERSLQELRKNAEEEQYLASLETELESLRKKLADEKSSDLLRHRTEIMRLLREEIVARYAFQSGRTAVRLSADSDVKTAIEILTDPERYRLLLSPPADADKK
jgi:carboxyl-terminal processing protease